jgi:CheY-like chemotaxis protein
MDISMPVLDGLEATRMIRAAEEPGRHLPIVALTAHALPDDVRRFREAGLDDVLIKPISRASLGDLIARFAGRQKKGESPSGGHSEPGGSMLVNEAQIEEMRQLLGAERTGRQIGLFLKEMEDLLATVSLATTTGARESDIRLAVHRLAGSAGMVGATALRAHLQEMETSLVTHPDVAKVDVNALDATATATMLALRRVQERIVLS